MQGNPSSASARLTDYSQVDIPRPRYTSVDVGMETRPRSHQIGEAQRSELCLNEFVPGCRRFVSDYLVAVPFGCALSAREPQGRRGAVSGVGFSVGSSV